MAGRQRRGRGEGSITKRADGRWEARLDLGYRDGGRQHRSIYGRTRAQAAQKLRDAQAALDAGLPLADGRTTVETFLRHWLKNVLPGTVAPATLDSYRTLVERHIIPTLGRIRLRRLEPDHVEMLLQAKAEEGLSANTRRLIRATLRRALSVAVRKGQVARNVAALVDGPKVVQPKRRALTVDEARRLLDAIRDDRLEAFFLVLLELGLRKGEASALRWDDIDLEARTLVVRATLSRQTI